MNTQAHTHTQIVYTIVHSIIKKKKKSIELGANPMSRKRIDAEMVVYAQNGTLLRNKKECRLDLWNSRRETQDTTLSLRSLTHDSK